MYVYQLQPNGNWEWKRVRKFYELMFPDDAEILAVDFQLGHEDVRPETLRNIVNWCLAKPHRYIILHDFLDNKWLSRYAEMSWGERSSQQIELGRLERHIKILEPIFHRFLFQVGSNHTNRYFGLHLTSKRSQEGRNQFNKIYGGILQKNPDFKIFKSCEIKAKLKFTNHPSLIIVFIHPSRLGSPTTAMNRVAKYFGAYGVQIGHIHSNIRKCIESGFGKKLKIWFSSHLFSEQPEYEKERMAISDSSEPLILGWKQNPLTGKWEFDEI